MTSKKGWLAGMAAIMAVAVALACAPAASATAAGCSVGNPNYGPTSYCVWVSGSGLQVSSVTGNFSGSAPVKDWYITAEFYNTGWGWYQTINGPYHSGCCSTGGGNVIYINARKQAGYVCSTLHYQGLNYGPQWVWRAMSVCQVIHP